jgi:hypothetical protein
MPNSVRARAAVDFRRVSRIVHDSCQFSPRTLVPVFPRRLVALAALPSAAALGFAALTAPSAGSAEPGGSDDDRRRVSRLADVNGIHAAEMRQLLRDPSVRLTDEGRAYVVDPAAQGEVGPTPAAREVAPLSQTFRLHSNPRARRTIFLDFDGTQVRGTAWNSDVGVKGGRHAGWDLANNGRGFTDREKRVVQSVWARVAEDYAPFAIDVTTAQPPSGRITRSRRGDKVYGTRVLISESRDAHSRICDQQCGGVAFINVFSAVGKAHRRHQPAWVFPAGLSQDTKAVAEAVTHEAGHTFGLVHDGGLLSPYYEGHGSWAPIMGAAYFRPISQWSRGSYSGATTSQDDLAVIARRGAPDRRDEAGSKPRSAARRIPDRTAYITRGGDVDVFRLGRCTGRVRVRAVVARVSPNLDVRLRLLRQGTPVGTSNPLSGTISRDRARGPNATVAKKLRRGVYYAEVDGVGRGAPSTSYDDYGSLGAYKLTVHGC